MNFKNFNVSKFIGVTAPASDFNKENFLKGIQYLKDNGYSPIFDKEILKDSSNYLKGDDNYRKKSFETLLNDERVNTIIMARGGYGSIRTLNLLDKELLLKRKPLLVGFSDITTFHVFMNNNNIPSLHAPMVNAFLRDIESTEKLFKVLKGDLDINYNLLALNGTHSIEGELIGGNLAVIISLIGTDYELKLNNKILFLEDVNEPLYKIDRMLMQLILSKHKPKAIVLGQFLDCDKIEDIERLFLDIFSDIPIYSRLDVGHNNKTQTLPLGVRYKIDKNRLFLLK